MKPKDPGASINESINESIKDLVFKMNASILAAMKCVDHGQDPLIAVLPVFGMPSIVRDEDGDNPYAMEFKVVVRPTNQFARYTLTRNDFDTMMARKYIRKAVDEMMKAGNSIDGPATPPAEFQPELAKGLTIGRVVHVWVPLSRAMNPIVERPAIVTQVLDKSRGEIAAQIFMSPYDPPGVPLDGRGKEVGWNMKWGLAEDQRAGTWHWPERE